MSINSKVLHISLFEYLYLISLSNIVSVNHLLPTSAESTSKFIHVVACNLISSSPWKIKLLAGVFAGLRTTRAVRTYCSCMGIFSAHRKQRHKGISLLRFAWAQEVQQKTACAGLAESLLFGFHSGQLKLYHRQPKHLGWLPGGQPAPTLNVKHWFI